MLFFLDFLIFIFLEKWIVFSLLMYFFIEQLTFKNNSPCFLKSFFAPFFFILLQDCFINERFGLCLIYLPVLICFINKIKKFLCFSVFIFFPFLVIFSMIFDDFFIKRYMLYQNISIYSTISKIFINLIVGYLVLLGMRGNRSFNKF